MGTDVGMGGEVETGRAREQTQTDAQTVRDGAASVTTDPNNRRTESGVRTTATDVGRMTASNL